MRNSFKTVAKGMSIVVEGIDTPLVTNVRMRGEPDSVNDWIPQSGVGMFVVDFGSE